MSGKKESIRSALESKNKEELVELGITSGGFINDKLRRVVWPELTHAHAFASKIRKGSISNRLTQEDRHQVIVDAERAQFFSQVNAGSLKSYRIALSNVIFHVLEKYHG